MLKKYLNQLIAKRKILLTDVVLSYYDKKITYHDLIEVCDKLLLLAQKQVTLAIAGIVLEGGNPIIYLRYIAFTIYTDNALSTLIEILLNDIGVEAEDTVEREGHYCLTYAVLMEFADRLDNDMQRMIRKQLLENAIYRYDSQYAILHYVNYLIDSMIKVSDVESIFLPIK